MPYVICEPCVGVKNTACVGLCPVDAIHPGSTEGNFPLVEQLFIDPGRCTDCGACADACPASAIFAGDDVPFEWQSYIKKNAAYYT